MLLEHSLETAKQFRAIASAMRVGAEITYDIHGPYADGRGGVCAIGAAMVGAGLLNLNDPKCSPDLDLLVNKFEILKYYCFRASKNYYPLWWRIIELYEGRNWSKSKICRFLERAADMLELELSQKSNKACLVET